MPQFDEKHVKAEGCVILWDSVSRPESNEAGQKHSLKVAIAPHNPDCALLQQLAQNALQQSEFRGTLPNGGTMPMTLLGPNDFGGQFNGWYVFNCGTYRGVPDIYIDNARADLMQAGGLLYGGQVVDVLVHAYVNNKKVKGVAFGLDGFNIQAHANAERQNFGGAGVDTSAAFGGTPGNAPAAGAGAPSAPGTLPGTAAPASTPPASNPPQQSTDYMPPPPVGAQAQPMPLVTPAQYSYNGAVYTADQLRAAGWNDAQIEGLPRA